MLSKRYRPSRGGSDEMIEYNKFFADYEKIEKLGLKAGFDPLKNTNKDPNSQTTI